MGMPRLKKVHFKIEVIPPTVINRPRNDRVFLLGFVGGEVEIIPELADYKHSSSCPVEKVKAFEMRRDQLSTFLEIFRNDIFASIDISDDEDSA